MAWMHGKRFSKWHWVIQPNAVVSVLVVAFKAALMVSTASCISRLKWTHFQHGPRQLRNLEDFDDASRGAWGPLRLVLHRSGYKNIAVTLGCLVTILVLAMETFGQQLLSFPERQVAVTNVTATFPVIQNFAPDNVPDDALGDRLQRSQLRLMQSIYITTTDPPFSCPASSCPWGSHVTMGVCSSCQDISSTVGYCKIHVTEISSGHGADYNRTTLVCDYPTFDGHHNVSTTRDSTLTNGEVPDANNASAWTYYTRVNVTTWNGDIFTDVGQPAVALNLSTIVTNDDWDHVEITLCAIYWCAWVYEASSAQGQDFSADQLDKYILGYKATQRAQTGPGFQYDATNYTFSANGTGLPSDRHNETCVVHGDTMYDMTGSLTQILESITLSHDSSSAVGLGNASITSPNITVLAERMSPSITNVWRQYQSSDSIGTAWESVSFIHVDWAWLVLPVTAVLGACMLLFVILLQNRRTVTWKSSVLA